MAGAETALGKRDPARRSSFPVARLLTYEPDRGDGFSDLAPRALIGLADLVATGLVTAGSRVQYKRLVAAPAETIAALDELTLPEGVRLQTPRDGRPEIGNSVARAQQLFSRAAAGAFGDSR